VKNIFLIATTAIAAAIFVESASATPSLRLAMGPVSAPRLPAGNPNGPASPPSGNPPATSDHQKTSHHKKPTRRHKHSELGLALHFIV
jgi:hypothetical protein